MSINLSLGGSSKYTSPCTSDMISAAFGTARDAGMLPVVAAGNNGWTDGITFPACAEAAVSVGAVFDGSGAGPTCGGVGEPNAPTCFTNSAPFMTMFAPGNNIDAAGTTGFSGAPPGMGGRWGLGDSGNEGLGAPAHAPR